MHTVNDDGGGLALHKQGDEVLEVFPSSDLPHFEAKHSPKGEIVRQAHTIRRLGGSGSVARDVLGMLYHKVAFILEDYNLDGELVVDDGLQLLQVHHQAAISHEAEYTSLAAGEARTDGGRQPTAHLSQPARGQQALGGLGVKDLMGTDAWSADLSYNDLVGRQVRL